MMLLSLQGKVLKGRGLGGKIGFRTINLAYDGVLSGVFCGRVKIDEKYYSAAVNLGTRPTVDDEKGRSAKDRPKLCEIHVLDFEGEPDFVELELFVKIREIQKFVNLELLKEQIAKDVAFVRNWYNNFRYA